MDWAGIIIERVTKMTLNDYFQENVFKPLAIKDVSLVPSKDMMDRMIGIWQRGADGRITRRPLPLSKPLHPPQASSVFQSGGGGIFGSIREYSSTSLPSLTIAIG